MFWVLGLVLIGLGCVIWFLIRFVLLVFVLCLMGFSVCIFYFCVGLIRLCVLTLVLFCVCVGLARVLSAVLVVVGSLGFGWFVVCLLVSGFVVGLWVCNVVWVG